MTAKRKRPEVRFVALGRFVQREISRSGARHVCLARSDTSAKRIAAALNLYEAVRRGEV